MATQVSVQTNETDLQVLLDQVQPLVDQINSFGVVTAFYIDGSSVKFETNDSDLQALLNQLNQLVAKLNAFQFSAIINIATS